MKSQISPEQKSSLTASWMHHCWMSSESLRLMVERCRRSCSNRSDRAGGRSQDPFDQSEDTVAFEGIPCQLFTWTSF
ncbi:unnamed protein product [Arabidopsis halleri]